MKSIKSVKDIDELKGRKKCGTCKQEKLLDEFYFNRLVNRYRSDCKKCNILASNNWIYKNKIKHLHSVRVYQSTLKGKVVTDKNTKNMHKKYPEKLSARTKLRYAVKTGKIAKFACEKCGNFLSEAHHTDYSKALDVIWLCRPHHRIADRGELFLYNQI
ncbi:hypothetical protein M0R04_10355 [Candidatus Dojkabacteria bacterium]|jgi:hypothetical protein|nr:hypothetical protein [Candidatus Dojkabacteria bacterium]